MNANDYKILDRRNRSYKHYKRCSDKNIERVIKAPAFFFVAKVWSHLPHSWPGLKYMCKAKYKTLENR